MRGILFWQTLAEPASAWRTIHFQPISLSIFEFHFNFPLIFRNGSGKSDIGRAWLFPSAARSARRDWLGAVRAARPILFHSGTACNSPLSPCKSFLTCHTHNQNWMKLEKAWRFETRFWFSRFWNGRNKNCHYLGPKRKLNCWGASQNRQFAQDCSWLI